MPDLNYDAEELTSVLAYIRSLIPDTELLEDPHDPAAPSSYLFDDATLTRFVLFARGQSPKRAAADACMALAGSELLILKKLTTEDLATDGPAVAREHRERAKRYRDEADEDDVAGEDNAGFATSAFLKRPVPYDPMRRPWWSR